MDLFALLRYWNIVLPAPMVKWPTSLLPASPHVIPTALPEACKSKEGKLLRTRSIKGVCAYRMALQCFCGEYPHPSKIVRTIGFMLQLYYISVFNSNLKFLLNMRSPISQEEISKRLEEISKLGLKEVLDSLPIHFAITDANANILYANKAAEVRTGFSLKEAVGKNPADLWGGQMPKEFYEKMWQTIKVEKKPFVAEVQNRRKDGSTYLQELHVYPILGGDGEPRFFIGIEPDIKDDEERRKFKDEFVSMVSNQLKDPLDSVNWLISFFSKNIDLTEEQKNVLKEIYRQSKNLSVFIDN